MSTISLSGLLNNTYQGVTGFTGSQGFIGSRGFTGSVGPAGTGSIEDMFFENKQVITQNYTIASNRNAMSAGPIEIGNGVTVTIASGGEWSII